MSVTHMLPATNTPRSPGFARAESCVRIETLRTSLFVISIFFFFREAIQYRHFILAEAHQSLKNKTIKLKKICRFSRSALKLLPLIFFFFFGGREQ